MSLWHGEVEPTRKRLGPVRQEESEPRILGILVQNRQCTYQLYSKLLKGRYVGDYIGEYYRGCTRSLDYSSYERGCAGKGIAHTCGASNAWQEIVTCCLFFGREWRS